MIQKEILDFVQRMVELHCSHHPLADVPEVTQKLLSHVMEANREPMQTQHIGSDSTATTAKQKFDVAREREAMQREVLGRSHSENSCNENTSYPRGWDKVCFPYVAPEFNSSVNYQVPDEVGDRNSPPAPSSIGDDPQDRWKAACEIIVAPVLPEAESEDEYNAIANVLDLPLSGGFERDFSKHGTRVAQINDTTVAISIFSYFDLIMVRNAYLDLRDEKKLLEAALLESARRHVAIEELANVGVHIVREGEAGYRVKTPVRNVLDESLTISLEKSVDGTDTPTMLESGLANYSYACGVVIELEGFRDRIMKEFEPPASEALVQSTLMGRPPVVGDIAELLEGFDKQQVVTSVEQLVEARIEDQAFVEEIKAELEARPMINEEPPESKTDDEMPF